MALRQGLYSVVKASLTGSIIGNILLVLGAAVLAGGLKHKHQRFNVTGARAQATLLTLAAIALIMPAAFHALAGPGSAVREDRLSLGISLRAAGCLRSPPGLLAGHAQAALRGQETKAEAAGGAAWSLKRSVLTLAGCDAADRLDQRDSGGLRTGSRHRARHDQRLHRRDRGSGRGQRRRAQHRGHAGDEEPDGAFDGHRHRQQLADRAVGGARCW